jgi:hypothetical protein
MVQAGGEPAGMTGAEADRRAALAAGDAAAAAAAEAALLAALLGAQFGAARVDPDRGFVLVDVRAPRCSLPPAAHRQAHHACTSCGRAGWSPGCSSSMPERREKPCKP